MSLFLVLTSLVNVISGSNFPDEFGIRSDRLTMIEHVARTERDLIDKLISIKDIHSDPEGELEFFIEFLIGDTGFPFEEPVEETVKYLVERFKIVERFLYDWPMIAEVVDSLEVDHHLDIIAEFVTTVPQLPTFSDLSEIVRQLNEAMALDRLLDTSEVLLDGMEFNTGNYLILTNVSHGLGHVNSCVEWGDLADSDLVLAEEPFTIPGEEHWLNQYLVYLECLIKVEDEEQANIVRDEILGHYNDDEGVKKAVRMLSRGRGKLVSRDSEIDRCTSDIPSLDSYCYLQWSRDPFTPMKIEKISGTSIIFYREVGEMSGVRTLGRMSGDVLLDNSGGWLAVRVVSNEGVIIIEPGDALVIPPQLISHICGVSRGILDLYSL